MEIVVSFSLGMFLGALISASIVVSLWNKSLKMFRQHLDEIAEKFDKLCECDKKIINELLDNKNEKIIRNGTNK